MHVNLISCPGTRSIRACGETPTTDPEEKFARLCSNERNEGKKKKKEKKKRTKGEERYIVFVRFSSALFGTESV